MTKDKKQLRTKLRNKENGNYENSTAEWTENHT